LKNLEFGKSKFQIKWYFPIYINEKYVGEKII